MDILKVTECGSRMIDIDIAGKDMDGEYKLKKGRGAVYDGPSSLNLRYKKVKLLHLHQFSSFDGVCQNPLQVRTHNILSNQHRI